MLFMVFLIVESISTVNGMSIAWLFYKDFL